MNKIKVIAIFGKAGSGKDTLLRTVCDRLGNKVNEIISFTTRPPREGEQDGINYYFLSTDEFAAAAAVGEMLEWCSFNGWYYGTGIQALEKDKVNIGVFNPSGIRALSENPQIELRCFYVMATDKTRLLRQLNREEQPDCHEIARRFLTDEEDFDPAVLKSVDWTMVVNHSLIDLQVAADHIEAAVKEL